MNTLQEISGYCDGQSSYYGISRQQCTSPTYVSFPDNGETGYGAIWRDHDINFNNFLTSFVSLFVLSTLEGWPDYMYQVKLLYFKLIDGNTDQIGPTLNNNQYVIGFFFIFILIGSVLCINLFVAILSMNFNNA
jgi:hypothetical protein